jgi:hypothetical protein
LRVRLHRFCEGILVNLSETGALVQVPSAQTPKKVITLQVEWQGATLQLPGRVVRSSPQPLALPTATLSRTEYQVAVEFSGIEDSSATLLRTILEHSAA